MPSGAEQSQNANCQCTWPCAECCSSSFDEAFEILTKKCLASCLNFMIADRSGKIATIECTPRGLAPIFPEPGTHTTFHTNHLWSPDIPQGIRDHPSKNSFTRLERIKALTKGQVGSVAKIRSWLSDEEGTPVSICRSTPLGARGIRTWYPHVVSRGWKP
jgi:isopenicillin-N N-acyltransferase like protein